MTTVWSMLGLVLFLGGLFGLAGHGIWRAVRSEAEGDRVVEGGPTDPPAGIPELVVTPDLAGVPDRVPTEWVMAYRAELDG